ncbi:cytochrome ubiquinol oxidase subunit I [Mobiluncus mulieris]|nr:cytochrome ubiquinol oxidase subunit I [Mobiluncus mulieris]MCU9973636.1 cytochrome ubiquinol oxidase subunit I [Mobiluncus mulieris]MCU9993400.1 cytochrome ubiquinol oxidase subunit I [Mobiluncus mulieris]MCU9996211.1 cytochrome ubiquinol oxidase subunit I [Mobiluncus mulieris]MCV0009276.1 cytochrome ubiquinol oxidase subunit I [Mobiluncus mulieris]MCV0012881.1 cytochrome ubiquinol oxidase subunit I [Mobiluncus mulieris]
MGLLDSLDLARWQFGVTTVYHFILVPFTIGMSLLVALMETLWYRTGKEYWLKATRFFGKLFLVNFALGVATGIVQEFQFGMGWSEYSRFVGDIFGAPLAFEALLSFFMESTFLGVWIFGWGKISKKAHVVVAWLVMAGVNTSMLWIIGANSWMQRPVGAVFNPETGRAELNGALAFFSVVTNSTMWLAVLHVVTSSILLAATVVAGISIWWMVRAASQGGIGETEAREVWRPIARWGMTIMLAAGLLTVASGHLQGQHLVYYQPAKMAAAEGLCAGESGNLALFAFSECPDPVLKEGAGENSGSKYEVTEVGIGRIPGLLGFVAHNSFSRTIAGVADSSDRTQAMLENAQKYFKDKAPNIDTTNTSGLRGKGDVAGYSWAKYAPSVLPVFWSFRLMMGVGIFMAALAMLGLYQTRGGRVSTSRGLKNLALITLPMPFLGVSFGWIMTEIGRQPFIVYPNQDAFNADMTVQNAGAGVYMLTGDGLSGVVSPVEFLISLVVFTLLYLVLGIIWFKLLVRYSKEGINTPASDGGPVSASQELSFAY